MRLNKRKWNMLFMDSISELDCQQVKSQTEQFALSIGIFILGTLDFKRFHWGNAAPDLAELFN